LLFLLDLRAQSGRQRTGGRQAKANQPKDHSNCMLAPARVERTAEAIRSLPDVQDPRGVKSRRDFRRAGK
jgi:hypothetical protein